MSLARYEEARPWAKAIKEEVLERRMPPWGAVKGFGEFANDAGLSQEEIELIADWVEGGAPEGEPQYLPPMPAVSPEAAPPRGREAIVSGKLRLREPLAITVLRPASIAAGSSVQVIAVRPDASVEPLLWLYNYDPKWQRAYVLREPLRLPAGSEIRVSGGASVAVLFAAQR